jgi:hypothetical protein
MAVKYRISVLREILMNLTLTIPFGMSDPGQRLSNALIGA